MNKIIEIALGVVLGLVIFLVILWLIGTCVYICCGSTKKIASIRKIKHYKETTSEKILPLESEVKEVTTPVIPKEVTTPVIPKEVTTPVIPKEVTTPVTSEVKCIAKPYP